MTFIHNCIDVRSESQMLIQNNPKQLYLVEWFDAVPVYQELCIDRYLLVWHFDDHKLGFFRIDDQSMIFTEIEETETVRRITCRSAEQVSALSAA